MGRDIAIDTPDGSIGAWRADPEGAPLGALIVVQEIFGVNAHIRAVCADYAAHGSAVLAPAFFDHFEPGVELDYDADGIARGRALVERLGLPRGAPISLHTANGTSTGYRTQLASLQLGDILLSDVRALIAPGMHGEEVLLGMSALKQLEFTQRDGTLLLRQTTTQ